MKASEDLKQVPVAYSHSAPKQCIEELYECDSGGSISVTISNKTVGSSHSYRLGKWSMSTKAIKPAARRKSQLGTGTTA
jgi:hypothetical protein